MQQAQCSASCSWVSGEYIWLLMRELIKYWPTAPLYLIKPWCITEPTVLLRGVFTLLLWGIILISQHGNMYYSCVVTWTPVFQCDSEIFQHIAEHKSTIFRVKTEHICCFFSNSSPHTSYTWLFVLFHSPTPPAPIPHWFALTGNSPTSDSPTECSWDWYK